MANIGETGEVWDVPMPEPLMVPDVEPERVEEPVPA